jgi:hypothetical protein
MDATTIKDAKNQFNDARKQEKPPFDKLTVPSVQASVHLVHCAAGINLAPSDDPMIFIVDIEGPIRRTREGGVNGSRQKLFSKEMKTPTRRIRLPTHVSDSLPKLAKST